MDQDHDGSPVEVPIPEEQAAHPGTPPPLPQCAAKTRKPYPGFWVATVMMTVVLAARAGLAAFLIYLWSVITMYFATPGKMPNFDLGDSFAAYFVPLFGLVLSGVAVWGWRQSGLGCREAFGLRPPPRGAHLAAPIASIGLAILASELGNLLFHLPISKSFFTEFQMFVDRPVPLILGLVIIAPLSEEFLFRGLFLRGFEQRYGAVRAIVLQALLFSAIHFSPLLSPPAFLYGVLFGFIYVRTRSLYPCIVAHMSAYTFLAIMVLSPIDIPGLAVRAVGEFQPVWLNATGVVMMVAGVWAVSKCRPGRVDDVGVPATEEVVGTSA